MLIINRKLLIEICVIYHLKKTNLLTLNILSLENFSVLTAVEVTAPLPSYSAIPVNTMGYSSCLLKNSEVKTM